MSKSKPAHSGKGAPYHSMSHSRQPYNKKIINYNLEQRCEGLNKKKQHKQKLERIRQEKFMQNLEQNLQRSQTLQRRKKSLIEQLKIKTKKLKKEAIKEKRREFSDLRENLENKLQQELQQTREKYEKRKKFLQEEKMSKLEQLQKAQESKKKELQKAQESKKKELQKAQESKKKELRQAQESKRNSLQIQLKNTRKEYEIRQNQLLKQKKMEYENRRNWLQEQKKMEYENRRRLLQNNLKNFENLQKQRRKHLQNMHRQQWNKSIEEDQLLLFYKQELYKSQKALMNFIQSTNNEQLFEKNLELSKIEEKNPYSFSVDFLDHSSSHSKKEDVFEDDQFMKEIKKKMKDIEAGNDLILEAIQERTRKIEIKLADIFKSFENDQDVKVLKGKNERTEIDPKNNIVIQIIQKEIKKIEADLAGSSIQNDQILQAIQERIKKNETQLANFLKAPENQKDLQTVKKEIQQLENKGEEFFENEEIRRIKAEIRAIDVEQAKSENSIFSSTSPTAYRVRKLLARKNNANETFSQK